MEYFLDCADEAVIRTALDYYPLDGVTTNPGILSRDSEKADPWVYAFCADYGGYG